MESKPETKIKVSLCDKIKRLFVSSSCCNEIHNETIIIKKEITIEEINFEEKDAEPKEKNN